MFFYQANHGAYSNPAIQVGAPEQGFWKCFVDDLYAYPELSIVCGAQAI